MVTKRILVFGGSGQVGSALQSLDLPPEWALSAPPRAECDFTNPLSIGKIIHNFRPSLVINAAAFTDVDTCEKEPDRAMHLNFEAVAALAAYCVELNAPLIHLSTDYVFDGVNRHHPYKEEEEINPVNEYGKSKVMGEEAVRQSTYWHVILRTSLVFSEFGTNLLTKAIQQIDTKDAIRIVADQTGCPTGARSLAMALVSITDAVLNGKADGFGTFHFCGQPQATRFEIAQSIMDAYKDYTSRRPHISPLLSADFPTRAIRPAYSVLDCSKILRVYGILQPVWQNDLLHAVKVLSESAER